MSTRPKHLPLFDQAVLGVEEERGEDFAFNLLKLQRQEIPPREAKTIKNPCAEGRGS
ncbi:hypothetical protein [Variovorax sp. GB1P17]|uniref:hypothetical protein n=1 Tax=Variovorax sp. GB1P17 TaxID=3443740 RepID=UPI003F496CC7